MSRSDAFAVVFGVVVLAAVGSTARAGFIYPDFSSTAGLRVIGDAAPVGGRIWLDSAAGGNQDGWAWRAVADDAAGGFTTTFTFQYDEIGGIRDSNGNVGTDGIAFELQPYSSHNMPADFYSPHGLSVWYDAFDNGSDVSSSRVAVYSDGALIGEFNTEPLGIRFRDEKPHSTKVSLDGTALSVWVDGVLVGQTNDVSLRWLGTAYAGFVGSTASAVADQELVNWDFETPEPGDVGVLTLAAVPVGIVRRRRA